MDFFLNLVVSGIVTGCMFGLVAIGFALIYKTTGIVNFAQGEVMMFITYIAWSVSAWLPLSFLNLIIASILIAAACGALLERLFIRPMAGEPQIAIIMTTVGVAIVLRGMVPLLWGVESAPFEAPFKSRLVEIGPLALFGEQVFAFLLFAAVGLGVWAFFRFSRVGAAMRATALDETAAMLMGVNVRRLHTIAWMISAGVSGLAGVTYAIAISRAPDMWLLGLQSFPATILGGLDSVIGSGLGGLVIGVTSNLSEGYIGQGLKEISGFVIIIVILMVRPYGLFGEKELERV